MAQRMQGLHGGETPQEGIASEVVDGGPAGRELGEFLDPLLDDGTAVVTAPRAQGVDALDVGQHVRLAAHLVGVELQHSLLGLDRLWGETIVSNGGDPASWPGLTTQNAVRTVYLTSGPVRQSISARLARSLGSKWFWTGTLSEIPRTIPAVWCGFPAISVLWNQIWPDGKCGRSCSPG